MNRRPDPSEFNPFYAAYVARVPEGSILDTLAAQPAQVQRLAAGVPAERETFRYAEGKWSIREVVGHVCDTERVFGYRALCIGRGDATSLPGFDEKAYAAAADAHARPLAELAAEFGRARAAHLDVLRNLSERAFGNLGNANESPVSVRGLAWIMAGHALHHLCVLRERYGVE